MSRVPFNDAYKEWRNLARRYNRRSIIDEALRFLCEPPSEDPVTELRKASWLTMLMVKWVCQDRYHDRNPAKGISRPKFDELRQRLWNVPERLSQRDSNAMPLHLFMRQLLRPQLGFQRRITRSFVREAVLVADQDADFSLRILFKSKTGFDVMEFIDLSLATFGAVMSGNRRVLDSYFKPLMSKYTEATVTSYTSAIARTVPELIEFCRALPNADRKVASEYFEFPALARYPFLRIDDSIVCWHPTVFFRGVEGFVHSVLSEAGQQYIEPFSRLFERYVVTQARKVPTLFIDENELQGYIGQDTRVPDGLLSFPDCNVFIESKAGLFNESVMTVGSSEVFAHKTRAVTTAVHQAWDTCASLREQKRAPENVLDAQIDYLLIITNKELGTSRGSSFASMYPEGTLDYPNAEAERLLPLSRVYVLTIEDFERLTTAAANGTLKLPNFLASCVKDDSAPETSLMLFEQHLQRHGIPMEFAESIESAIDASTARLEAAMG